MAQYEKWNEHCNDCGGFETSEGQCPKCEGLGTLIPGYKKPLHFDGNNNCIYDINSVTNEIENDTTNAARILRKAIAEGRINTSLHKGHQNKHIPGTQNYKQELANGRMPSILTADAQALIHLYAGKGIPVMRKGKWMQAESFTHTSTIGIYKNKLWNESYDTKCGRIHYSNKGAHIVPDKKDGNGKN